MKRKVSFLRKTFLSFPGKRKNYVSVDSNKTEILSPEGTKLLKARQMDPAVC